MTIVYDPTDELEIAVYKIFNKFSGQILEDPVYLMDSNFIPPVGPYVVLKLNEITSVSGKTGWQTSIDPDTGEQTTYNNFVGIANVYTYGARAFSKAQAIAFATKENNLKKLLNDNGIGVSNTSAVRNASRAISGTEMEERAQFSISFNFVQSYTGQSAFGVIDSITASGSLVDSEDTVTDTESSATSPDVTP